ncbi:MAG: class F sortase [Candidatus Saccharimonadales bacterium]
MPRRVMPIQRELALALKEAGRECTRLITIRRRSGELHVVFRRPRWKRLGKVSRRMSAQLAHSKPVFAGLASFVLLIGGLAGLVYSIAPLLAKNDVTAVATTANSPRKISPQTPQSAEAPSNHLGRSQPTRLTIPSIGVDTELTTISLDERGVLQPPDRFDIAGWYDKSPTPGELGPSIIVGHVDSPHDIAVFFYVKTLQAGQAIHITRADGSAPVFVVDSVALYDQNNFPTQAVYGNIDHAGLRLITCGGAFNPLTGHYEQNTVVYAHLQN